MNDDKISIISRYDILTSVANDGTLTRKVELCCRYLLQYSHNDQPLRGLRDK